MSRSLYSGVNKVYFRSYLLFNIVASSAYIYKRILLLGFEHTDFAIVNFPSTIKRKFKSSVFTFASGNLILGVEPGNAVHSNNASH